VGFGGEGTDESLILFLTALMWNTVPGTMNGCVTPMTILFRLLADVLRLSSAWGGANVRPDKKVCWGIGCRLIRNSSYFWREAGGECGMCYCMFFK